MIFSITTLTNKLRPSHDVTKDDILLMRIPCHWLHAEVKATAGCDVPFEDKHNSLIHWL